MSRATWRSPIIVVGLAVASLATRAGTACGQDPSPKFTYGTAYCDSNPSHNLWWLGGDVAFGINLPGQGTLWTFSDTYLASAAAISASPQGIRPPSIVGNSIAFSTVDANGNFAPRYYFGSYPYGSGNMADFFPCARGAGNNNYKYWPLQSFMVGNTLYIFMQVVYHDANGYFNTGTDIVRVYNPLANPFTWQMDSIHLYVEPLVNGVAQRARLQVGHAALTQFSSNPQIDPVLNASSGNNVLVYGFYNTYDNPISSVPIVLLVGNTALANTASNALVDTNYTFHKAWTNSSKTATTWNRGLASFFTDAGAPAGTFDYYDTGLNPFAGFSVRFNTSLNKFQVVGAANGGIPSVASGVTTPMVWTSPGAAGPFTSAPVQFQIPELTTAKRPITDQGNLIVYGIHEWPLSPPDDTKIQFTYTVSATGNDSSTGIEYGRNELVYYVTSGQAPNPNHP